MTNIQKILLTGFGVCFALFLIISFLCLSAFSSRFGEAAKRAPLQLSRIDLLQPVDSSLGKSIQRQIRSFPAVNHVYFNHADDIVVFSHAPQALSADTILHRLRGSFDLPMERFRVSPEMQATSCPVTGPETPLMRYGGFLWRLVH